MKTSHRKIILLIAALLALGTSLIPSSASADPEYPMMGGYGPGMMDNGYGSGMMMGGYGRGMMGGYGHGMMMGRDGCYGIESTLNLTPDQQKKISKIREETRKSHWDIMGKMHEEHYKLRDLYYADKPDTKAISAQYKKTQELQQQMMETGLTSHNKIQDLLTKEQKEKLKGAGTCRMWDMD